MAISDIYGDKCQGCKLIFGDEVPVERIGVQEQKGITHKGHKGDGVFWRIRCGGCHQIRVILFSFDPK